MRHLVLGLVMALLLIASPAAGGGVGPFAYLSNSGGNDVLALDTSNPSTPSYVPVGKPTYGVAVDSKRGRAYVTDFSIPGHLYAIDISTSVKSLIGTVTVGNMPYGVAVRSDGTRVYVANVMSHTVSVIDPAQIGIPDGHPLLPTLSAGSFPWGVAVSSDGHIYVSNLFGGLVTAVDSGQQVPSDGGLPSGIAVSPDGRLYVTDYNFGAGTRLWVIDANRIGRTGAIINRVSVGLAPYAVVVNRDGTRAYVTNSGSDTVSVIDASTPGAEYVFATVPVGRKPLGLAITSDWSRVFVANNDGQSLTVINAATNTVVSAPNPDTVKLPVDSYPIAFGSFLTSPNGLTGRIHIVPAVVNMKAQGTVPVVIYGARDEHGVVLFDVDAFTLQNFSTIRLTIGPTSYPVKVKGNGEAMVNYLDFNGDGAKDVMVHIDMGAGQAAQGSAAASTSDCAHAALLTGMVTVGNGAGSEEVPFEGCDKDVRFRY